MQNSAEKTRASVGLKWLADALVFGKIKVRSITTLLKTSAIWFSEIDVFSKRTDYGTQQPFLKMTEQMQHRKYEKIMADAGYESVEKYLYLQKHGLERCIKP